MCHWLIGAMKPAKAYDLNFISFTLHQFGATLNGSGASPSATSRKQVPSSSVGRATRRFEAEIVGFIFWTSMVA